MVVVVVVVGGGGRIAVVVPKDYCCGNSTGLFCGGGERFGYSDGDFSWFYSRKC